MTGEGPPAWQMVREATRRLAPVAGDCAPIDAEILFLAATGWDKARLVGEGRLVPDPQAAVRFAAFVARRQTGEPVAYIVGTQQFWGLEFHVTPATLIPRPDSETLVEAALAHLPNDRTLHIADLGTGTGCILLSVLHERPRASGIGVDVSQQALAVAAANAARLGLAGRARFLHSDWYAALPVRETNRAADDEKRPEDAEGFDAILSNPPYIPTNDIAALMPDVRDYEPRPALDGGADGLDAYRIIAEGAAARLRAGGLLAVEVGIGQAADVAALFKAAGLCHGSVRRDLAGMERVVLAKKA